MPDNNPGYSKKFFSAACIFCIMGLWFCTFLLFVHTQQRAPSRYFQARVIFGTPFPYYPARTEP
jgi:hypothetical protein